MTLNKNKPTRRVPAAEFGKISSEYLSSDRRNESWKINRIDWDGSTLYGEASLNGYTQSKTDNGRFHLSIYAAREMEAQFAIIGIHLAANLTEKTTEIWQLTCREKCLSAITNPNNIHFETKISIKNPRCGKLLTKVLTRITDNNGGLFEIDTKAYLDLPSKQ